MKLEFQIKFGSMVNTTREVCKDYRKEVQLDKEKIKSADAIPLKVITKQTHGKGFFLKFHLRKLLRFYIRR